MFFGNNIKYLRKKKKLTQGEMPTAIGIARATWSNYELNQTEPDFKTLIIISELFGVSIDDLLRKNLEHEAMNVEVNGNSEKLRKQHNVDPNAKAIVDAKGSIYPKSGVVEPFILSEYEPNYGSKEAKIPITDISVAAGTGIYNEGHVETIDYVQLPAQLVKPGHTYLCVRIKGVSMAPTLQDGGFIVIRLLERSEWAKMPDERVFVVVDTDGKSYLKRVKNRFKQGFIVLKSDTPDQANYPSFNLLHNEIQSIWYAEWYFSAKMPNIHDQFYTRLQLLEDRVDSLASKSAKIKG